MLTLRLTAQIPADALLSLLRLVRAWEQRTPGVHLGLSLEAPEMSTADVIDLLNALDPPLPCVALVARAEDAPCDPTTP